MRLPSIKTVQYYDCTPFKAFELSASYQIDYCKLVKLIDCFCQEWSCSLQHFEIVPKKIIFDFWKGKLWEEGNNFFKREMPTQDRIDKIDVIIKIDWIEIWRDYHKQ